MNHTQSPESRVSGAVVTVLMLLTIFGPISMDLYLPVLPALTEELGAATSMAQLTVTACLLGLAFGQVIAGPLSDRFGRRIPVLIGISGFIVTSVLCALSPTIEVLIVVRFLQGLFGAVGLVISQAAGRDLYEGRALIRFYGRLTVLSGFAAIVGPLIGGQLARFTDWRGLFLFLAAIGGALLLAALLILKETLPVERRTRGGLGPILRDFRYLLSDRHLLGVVLVTGFVSAALFAYLSGATYVLQGIYGLTPQQYSFAFGLNSLGFMVFGYLSSRAAERWSETGALTVGLAMCGVGATGLLLTGLFQLQLVVVIVSLLVMVSGVAATSPPTTSLAMAGYPQLAGTASSLLGLTRFAFGGISAPLVGLGGADTVLPLGIVTVGSVVLAVVAFVMLVNRP
ncbi:MAG: multidrug effflux MFS transporter [Thermomicrobiales bacterium]|nr:multidrug effflux MFS transporter [Thermomicrobiales bacterium]